MKKILSVIFTFAIVLSMSACGESGATVENKTEDTTTVGEEVDVISSTHNIEFASLIPNPEDVFKDKRLCVSEINDVKYHVYMENCTVDDFNTYAHECMNYGISCIQYYDNDGFKAYLSDLKFVLSVYYNDVRNELGIRIDIAEDDETKDFSDEGYKKFADLIPNPEDVFDGKVAYISDCDGGSEYRIYLENCTIDDLYMYVDACEQFGIDHIDYYNDDSYSAYVDNDKYKVGAYFNSVRSELTISVN